MTWASRESKAQEISTECESLDDTGTLRVQEVVTRPAQLDEVGISKVETRIAQRRREHPPDYPSRRGYLDEWHEKGGDCSKAASVERGAARHVSAQVDRAALVLGKFGLRPTQTRFELNPNHFKWFGFGESWLKPNGLVSGLGVPNPVQTKPD
ncbi:hypothetical protein EDB84DRAFT_1440277 [Lactarius hengduanensis]|nr:hypothetical protein EDB84DRAFT_1440277 [Lactarius hengduanensis]